MLYETTDYGVKIEGDKITFTCRDTRLIAEGLDEKYRTYTHEPMTTRDFERFLEELTAEFWRAGVKDGKKTAKDQIISIEESIKSLIGGKF